MAFLIVTTQGTHLPESDFRYLHMHQGSLTTVQFLLWFSTLLGLGTLFQLLSFVSDKTK